MGSKLPCLETERLRLRPFTLSDVAAHRRLYADPEVTRHLAGGPYLGADARLRSERAVRRFVDHWRSRGFGVWAVLDRTTEAFVGQCGLNTIDGTGEVEALWALDRPAWGRGLATEAARAGKLPRAGLDLEAAVLEGVLTETECDLLARAEEARAAAIAVDSFEELGPGADAPSDVEETAPAF